MSFTSTAAIIAALGFLAYVFWTLRSKTPVSWAGPAFLSLAFLAFSLLAMLREGPVGFWPVHSRSLWGNQVWFDLLLAVAIGWTLILPRARAVGMRPARWLVLVCVTGCIGLLAMVARLLFLEQQAQQA